MQGATSHDGKLAGNRQLVAAYDSDHGRRSKHLGQKPKESGGESGGVHEPSGHDEIKQVVAEHGPAHKHLITKGEDGSHHSETHHESGHVHHADHDSLDEAHEHGKQAMEDTEDNPLNRESQNRAEERDRIESHGGSRGLGRRSEGQTVSFMED
jgi:hypothetical protein